MPRPNLYCLLFPLVLISLGSSQISTSARQDVGTITLSNHAISATWLVRGGSLRWQSLTNHFTGATLALDGSVFELVPKEGPVLRSSDLKMVGAPVLREISDSRATSSSRAADRLPGRKLRAELEDPAGNIQVTWKAILREDANYVRQEVTIRAAHQPLALAQVGLIDILVPGAAVSGQVKGSPVVAGTLSAQTLSA